MVELQQIDVCSVLQISSKEEAMECDSWMSGNALGCDRHGAGAHGLQLLS